MRSRLVAIAFAAASVLTSVAGLPISQAQAQNESTEGYSVWLDDGMLRLRDVALDRELITPNRNKIARQTSLQPAVRLVAQPDGADLIVTYKNTTSTPLPLGALGIGGIRFGRQIENFDFRRGAEPEIADHQDADYFRGNLRWPKGDIYSPVKVLRDDRHTIGFALLYNPFEYGHQCTVWYRSPTRRERDQGRNWEVEFKLDGQLPPGEERTYTLTVRVARPGEHWLKTLAPYRDYFRATYGGVQYTRDPRPVKGFAWAGDHELGNPENPRAFTYSNRRPDVNGFGPWAQVLSQLPNDGYQRSMNWAPSGAFQNNRDQNYPFPFMTGFRDLPRAMASRQELRSVAQQIDLGFWWGYSQRLMVGWDQPGVQLFDPDNPQHVQMIYEQLDMAVDLGAKIIGLDAFDYSQPVAAKRQLELLKARAPQVRFVTEPANADVFHIMTPTWFDNVRTTTPHVLADFLVPGHETWSGVRFDLLADRLGRKLTTAEMAIEMRRLADLGFVPVALDNVPVPDDLVAAESWTTSIPEALRVAPPDRDNNNDGNNQGNDTGGTVGGGGDATNRDDATGDVIGGPIGVSVTDNGTPGGDAAEPPAVAPPAVVPPNTPAPRVFVRGRGYPVFVSVPPNARGRTISVVGEGAPPAQVQLSSVGHLMSQPAIPQAKESPLGRISRGVSTKPNKQKSRYTVVGTPARVAVGRVAAAAKNNTKVENGRGKAVHAEADPNANSNGGGE
jgi:hypothetical protein